MGNILSSELAKYKTTYDSSFSSFFIDARVADVGKVEEDAFDEATDTVDPVSTFIFLRFDGLPTDGAVVVGGGCVVAELEPVVVEPVAALAEEF